MMSTKRLIFAFLSVALASILLSALITAGIIQLKNDNGEIYAGSRLGRFKGDIDGAVFTPDADLFPMAIQSVEFVFHRPQESSVPWIGDSARVRVQIYAMENGVPGAILAESGSRVFSVFDEWLSLPLTTPLTLNEATSFMAAVKWESGDDHEAALPLALDSNLGAPQAEKDAKNLYHRVDIQLPEACQTGFCTHSQLGLQDASGQSMGFNMIRVTIDTPGAPTETPAPPTQSPTATATATLTPQPTPGRDAVYLPAVFRNFDAFVQTHRMGSAEGEAVSYALTSGNMLRDNCWPGVDNTLWVGSEPVDERGIMRSVIWFDLSSVPQDAVVVEAGLRLVVVEAAGDPPMTVSVHDVAQAWDGCPTWNRLADAVGRTWGSVAVGSGIEVYIVDVTGLVRQWVAGDLPNYGLMLRGDETGVGQFRGFVPTASSQEDLRPVLVVRYRRPQG